MPRDGVTHCCSKHIPHIYTCAFTYLLQPSCSCAEIISSSFCLFSLFFHMHSQVQLFDIKGSSVDLMWEDGEECNSQYQPLSRYGVTDVLTWLFTELKYQRWQRWRMEEMEMRRGERIRMGRRCTVGRNMQDILKCSALCWHFCRNRIHAFCTRSGN